MLYMFLLHAAPDAEFPADTMDRHRAVTSKALAKNAYIYSEALGVQGISKIVRVRNGKAVTTDGPFAETKEVLGGFYILDCDSLEEALQYAAEIPDSWVGAVEVRPVAEVPGWDYAIAADRKRQPMGSS